MYYYLFLSILTKSFFFWNKREQLHCIHAFFVLHLDFTPRWPIVVIEMIQFLGRFYFRWTKTDIATPFTLVDKSHEKFLWNDETGLKTPYITFLPFLLVH